MEGISLQLLERRLCELTGMLNEVQSMKDYLLKKLDEDEKAKTAQMSIESRLEPFVEKP